MRVCMMEPCADADAGSIGAFYIREHARRAGYAVDVLRRPKAGYDVELISVHHCTDYPRVAALPKLARWRILGGHPMVNNPRPVIPFADAICVGEGESWIGPALRALEATNKIESLAALPGTIICPEHRRGDPLPPANVERPLPDNPPYLNRPGTLSAAWYVEIARGCPYSCHFCELGHSTPFRLYSEDHLRGVLAQADTSITRKINFYAPDEASHPKYHELYAHLRERGFAAGFSSMRIDSVLRRGLPDIPPNMLIRVGIDGMSEEVRQRVNKPISDDSIVRYFSMMLERGHVNFKTFFIWAYPWEKAADFEGFERLMKRVMALPLRTNVSLRIKWTPFIPQPCTPLGGEKPRFDYRMFDRINVWHALNARPRRNPGWYIENDGMMSAATHRRQCEYTLGDETCLMRLPRAKPLHPQAADAR